MYQLIELMKIEDYFSESSLRQPNGVYFYRFSDYCHEWDGFFLRLLEACRKSGVYIKGKIPNPGQRQLDFYGEMMGQEFRMDPTFIRQALSKWLPRLSGAQCAALEAPLWEELEALRKGGKTENMLKNAFIKFMCWFYYRFEQVLTKLGGSQPPKVLCEGGVGEYQLKLLRILARAGCDVALLIPEGEAAYCQADPGLIYSKRMENPRPKPFPAGFSVSSLAAAAVRTQPKSTPNMPPQSSAPQPTESLRPPVRFRAFRLEQPKTRVNINTWLTGNLQDDSLRPMEKRGREADTCYNMFVRVRGAEDRNIYLNELVRWKLKLEGAGRRVFLLEKAIPMPTVEEIGSVKRPQIADRTELLQGLTEQLQFTKNRELERHVKKAFYDILSDAGAEPLQRLNNRAVSALCWLRRYLPKLWPDGRLEPIPTLVYYGACTSETEAVLLRMLSRLPVDVWIICPDLGLEDKLSDPLLFDRRYENSLPLDVFPKQLDSVRFGTVAFHAQQELDTLLYQDTGMYRNHQFKKAIPVTIQTTYDEIGILWDQEAKYRPNFEILTDRVMVPVICAKVSGVPGGNAERYWSDIAKCTGEDVIFSDRVPFLQKNAPNPMVQHAPSFLKNRKLQVQKIKAHPAYAYAFIRADMQDYMMDKLQILMDRELITGTFRTGTEYTILSTALNLDKQILRMIQKYDFTKQIPKLVLINTGEQLYSLEDSIAVAYLNLLGFDIALFVPTGYQVMERHFQKPFFVEQQAGDYLYDLHPPDWSRVSGTGQRKSFTDILFRRGN